MIKFNDLAERLYRFIRTSIFIEPKEGQGLIEYALILFLIAIVVIAILILLQKEEIASITSAPSKGLQMGQSS